MITHRAALVALLALAITQTSSTVIIARERGKGITAEKNTTLSDLLKRLSLIETAGMKPRTGQYFVKIFRAPQGEECDVDGELCNGRDLLISVASPDLNGDHALYRVTGLSDWQFVEWKSYAEYDAPDYFTSFVVDITLRPGAVLSECRNRGANSDRHVTFEVNPWKVSCKYGR